MVSPTKLPALFTFNRDLADTYASLRHYGREEKEIRDLAR